VLEDNARVEAIDKRAAIGGIKPRSVGSLISADIHVEFPYFCLDSLFLRRRRKRQIESMRIHCVRHSVDHSSIGERPIRRSECLLVFPHNVNVLVKESKDTLDGVQASVIRYLSQG